MGKENVRRTKWNFFSHKQERSYAVCGKMDRIQPVSERHMLQVFSRLWLLGFGWTHKIMYGCIR